MPAYYNQSTTFYTDPTFGLYPHLSSNTPLDFGFYPDCGSETHIESSEPFLTSPEVVSSPDVFGHISTSSPVSDFSSPERTSDSESGDDGSSSGSDSDAEGEVDQGDWTNVDNHSYLSQALADFSPDSAEGSIYDLPYVPAFNFDTPDPQTNEQLYPSHVTHTPAILYSSPSHPHTPLGHSLLPAVSEIDLATFQDPPPRASRARANENISILLAKDSDKDAEGESDDDGSEDEYVPSPRPALRNRAVYRRAYHSRSNTPSTSSSSSPRPSPRSRPRPTAPVSRDTRLKRTRPRSAQLNTPLDPTQMRDFTCVCGYVQTNRRTPDFKRHLQTHTRSLEKDKWVCCGVPEGHPSAPHMASATVYEGRTMVGGCFKVFSRRDALKRHLDNKNTSCRGDLCGDWISETQ